MLANRARVAAALLMLVAPAIGQGAPPPLQEAKLTGSDAAALDESARAVAVSGNTAVIGSLYHDPGGLIAAGAAFVFVRTGTSWSQQAELTASTGPYFGVAVAVSGDTIAVGTHEASITAYVFSRDRTSWSQQAKLVASNGTAGPISERGLALEGDTLLVGTPNDGTDGSAYVFVRNGTTWTQQAKLTASDAAAGDQFGSSVALSGDTALIGAIYDDHSGKDNAGSAYVFVRNGITWSEQEKLIAADVATDDRFGFSVAAFGDTSIVGIPFDDDSGSNSGAAAVFVRSGTSWTQQAKLTAPDGATSDYFGISVAASGNTVVVGAHQPVSAAAGSAYVFVRSGTSWSQQPKAMATDAAAGDQLGYSVALSGDTAVAGAPYDDLSDMTSVGSAYVFKLQPTKLIGTVTSEATGLPLAGAVVSDSAQLSVQTDSQGSYVIDGAPSGSVTVTASATAFHSKSETVDVFVGVTTVADFALTPTFIDLGLALSGSAGLPVLVGAGTLEAGTVVGLGLSTAKPFSFAPLVVGISNISAPFKGGILVPSPNLIFPLFTDFFGAASFGGLWPPGVPSGLSTYFQWWIQDPAGPKGYAASNGVSGTSP